MPVPLVVDLSHHNTIRNDLAATRQAGVVGIIHKLTEGSTYVDEAVVARCDLAQEAGMAWGLYHFLRPGSMDEQAEYFIGKAIDLGVFNDATLVAADHEDPGVSLDDLMTFLDAVETLASRSCVIYSGHVLKDQLAKNPDFDLGDYRLWLAQYADQPVLPPGFTDYWLWQYTDKGEIPGIDPPTDLNASELSAEDLLASWAGMGMLPPTPDIYVATISITSATPISVEVEHGVVRYSTQRRGEPIFRGAVGRPIGPQRPDGTYKPEQ